MEKVTYIGYVSDEHAGAVLPVVSGYARKDETERRACDAARAAGLEPTSWEIFPASRDEEVRELVEVVAADSDGWQVMPAAELEPGAARAEAEEEREHYEAPYLPAMPADAAIDALAADGWTARYSKGGNVWVLDADEADDLRAYGLKWSAKRGQWWARICDQGRAVKTQYTRRGDLAA